MGTKVCPVCRAENRPEAKFCLHCGTPIMNVPVAGVYSPPNVPPPAVLPAYPAEYPLMPAKRTGSKKLSAGLSIPAVLLAAGFVFLFSLSLPVFGLTGGITNKDTYLKAIAEQGFYANFPTLFSDQMDYWINTLKSSTFAAELFFQNVTASDWKLIAENIVTPEWVQSQVESLFDQLFGYINGDQEQLTLNVSLGLLKQQLGSQVGIDTYHEIVASKPECSQLELIEWLVAPAINLLPICKMPAKQDLPRLTSSDPEQVLDKVLKDWAATIPAEEDLASYLDQPSLDELDALFSGVRLTRMISGALLGLSFVLLLLTFLFRAVRSLKGWLRLWGLSFLVSGGLIVLFSVLLAALSMWQVNSIIAQLKDILHPGTVSLIEECANQIALKLVSPIFIPAGVLVVVGFGMFGASMLLVSRTALKKINP